MECALKNPIAIITSNLLASQHGFLRGDLLYVMQSISTPRATLLAPEGGRVMVNYRLQTEVFPPLEGRIWIFAYESGAGGFIAILLRVK
jgi:hypothetical protein